MKVGCGLVQTGKGFLEDIFALDGVLSIPLLLTTTAMAGPCFYGDLTRTSKKKTKAGGKGLYEQKI